MNLAKQHGFSLLEVVVAFSILTLTLSTILAMFGTGLRSTALAHDYQQAQMVAETQLALLQGVDASQLQPGVRQGVVHDYAWESEVSAMEQELPSVSGVALYQLTVNVRWSDGEQERQVRLSSLRIGNTQ